MIDRTMFCEVRRWNGDPRGPFFSIRITSLLLTQPIEVPLIFGEAVRGAVEHQLVQHGMLEKGVLLGEAGIPLNIITDVEVPRRRMLHGYGVGLTS